MDGGNVSGNIQIREENNTQSKELLYGDWDNFKTTTDTVKVENDSEITIQIRVDLQASFSGTAFPVDFDLLFPDGFIEQAIWQRWQHFFQKAVKSLVAVVGLNQKCFHIR